MREILSIIISYLIDPFVWIFILIIIRFFSSKRVVRKVNLSIIILILVYSNPLLSGLAFRLYERNEKPTYKENKTYDYGILLTGFILENDPNTYENKYLKLDNYDANRFIHALELYHDSIFTKFIITGDGHDIPEAEVVKDALLRYGVPKKDILVESQANNTYENAIFTKKMLHDNDLLDREILLITSAFHMPRARRCFEKTGLNFDTFPIAYKTKKQYKFSFNDLIPSHHSLKNWKVIHKELVGRLVYNMLGYT